MISSSLRACIKSHHDRTHKSLVHLEVTLFLWLLSETEGCNHQ